MWLKHGTCTTAPQDIWSGANGADGIDSRYCSADSMNLLGVGAYFAEVRVGRDRLPSEMKCGLCMHSLFGCIFSVW